MKTMYFYLECEGSGVMGLQIEAAGKTVLSRHDGRCAINVRKEPPSCTVYDRDGNVVWGPSDLPRERRIQIERKHLEHHFARAVGIERGLSEIRPIEREVVKTVLHHALPPEHNCRSAVGRLVASTAPVLDRFPGVFDDAVDAMKGNPAAQGRLRNTLVMARALRESGAYPRDDIATARRASFNVDLQRQRSVSAVAFAAGAFASRPSGWTERELMDEVLCQLEAFELHDSILDHFIYGTMTQHLASGFVGMMEGYAGPEGAPPRPLLPPFPCAKPRLPGDSPGMPLPEDAERAHRTTCAVEAFRALRDLRGEDYWITEVTPVDACGGENLVIRGNGFGGEPGEVTIGWNNIPVEHWSDTEIVVRLPMDIRPGRVALLIFRGTSHVCDRFIDVYASQDIRSVSFFEGGLPTASLMVSPNVVAPGSPYTLAWTASAPAQIQFGSDPPLTVPATASATMMAPMETSTTAIPIELTATNRCGTELARAELIVHRRAQVRITGIEVTQATQFFLVGQPTHMVGTPLAGPPAQPDNSLVLVKGKPVLVRVYLSTDQDPGFNGGQVPAAEVFLSVRTPGARNGTDLPARTIPIQNETDQVTVLQQRSDFNNSANFFLSADLTTDDTADTLELEFSARVRVRGDSLDAVALDGGSLATVPLRFEHQPPLRIALVMVNLTAPQHILPSPNLLQAMTAIRRVASALPVADILFSLPVPREVLTFAGRLDQETSTTECDDAWPDLKTELIDLSKDYDGDAGLVWCGVLSATGTTWATLGCGGTVSHAQGVAAFGMDRPDVGAHELGHAFGLSHVDQDTRDGRNFDNYGYGPTGTPPASGSVGRRSIGEFGVDVQAFEAGIAAVFDPNTVGDFMNSTIQSGDWISPYTWKRFRSASDIRILRGRVGSASAIDKRPRETLHVYGTLDPQRRCVRLRRLYHLPRRSIGPGPRAETDWSIILLDEANRVLFEQVIRQHGENRASTIRIRELVPFDDRIRALEIRHKKDGTVLKRVIRPDKRPVIEQVAVKPTPGRFQLSWAGSKSLLYGVAATIDGGHSWFRVAKGIRKTNLDVLENNLGAHEKVVFRIIGTDGFNTVWTDTESLYVTQPTPFHILPIGFSEGAVLRAGRTIALSVVVVPGGFCEPPSDKDLNWIVDEKIACSGRHLRVTLDEGNHRIEVHLRREKVLSVSLTAKA